MRGYNPSGQSNVLGYVSRYAPEPPPMLRNMLPNITDDLQASPNFCPYSLPNRSIEPRTRTPRRAVCRDFPSSNGALPSLLKAS